MGNKIWLTDTQNVIFVKSDMIEWFNKKNAVPVLYKRDICECMCKRQFYYYTFTIAIKLT